MELQKRIELALKISESIEDTHGLDSKNLYDLQLHLSDALEQVKKLTIPVVTKSFKIEVHNNSGAWYEIVLADSYLEAKMKVEKAYPNNTHVSLECEYDKPIF